MEEPERNIYCKGYDHCLNWAVDQGWPSWQCAGCTEFIVQDAEKIREDIPGLLKIFGEVFIPSPHRKRGEVE